MIGPDEQSKLPRYLEALLSYFPQKHVNAFFPFHPSVSLVTRSWLCVHQSLNLSPQVHLAVSKRANSTLHIAP